MMGDLHNNQILKLYRLIPFPSFCPSRDQEWQLKEHPGPLLHPVTLQAAAAATAAVLPVPGGAQPADQQHRIVRQQPQDAGDAVQVRYTGIDASHGRIAVVSFVAEEVTQRSEEQANATGLNQWTNYFFRKHVGKEDNGFFAFGCLIRSSQKFCKQEINGYGRL